MLSLVKFIRVFFFNLRKFGLPFTVRRTLDLLGRKTYITVKYPVAGINVRARVDARWKSIAQDNDLNSMKYLLGIVKEGQVIIDAGAYTGKYVLLFSKLVRTQGQVYAFDPDPVAISILNDNVVTNRLSNVTIEEVCLSNSIGEVRLNSRGRGFGESFSTIISSSRKADIQEITVKAITIDNYCDTNSISPHGIKIDVEGAEALVIDGARSTIARCHPWVLLEFHGHLMTEEERQRWWHKITDGAKKLVFICGDSNQYHYGDKINSVPDCLNLRFHVFIQY